MTELYKNKFRSNTNRLQSWDYNSNAAYFITICTFKKEHFFGKVLNDTMQLSTIGELAEQYWHEIPIHFPFVNLGGFVVMPNHVHGIIIINKTEANEDKYIDEYLNDDVETQDFVSPPTLSKITTTLPESIQNNKFGPQSRNLASIIRGYKIGVTKRAKTINISWKWQPGYHDHIIRDNNSFDRIEEYIVNNPKNWKEDRYHSSKML